MLQFRPGHRQGHSKSHKEGAKDGPVRSNVCAKKTAFSDRVSNGNECQTKFAASVFVLATKAPKAPIPGWDVSEVGIRGERQWTCLRQCISWSVLQALTSWPRAPGCPSLSSQQEDSPACTDMGGCMQTMLRPCAGSWCSATAMRSPRSRDEPFAARSGDSAQRPQIGGPGAVRVHARWSWSSLALSRWLGGWGFAVGGMLAGVVFGAVGLAVGTCVAVRFLRASGRVPAFRIKSLAHTRQSTRRRGIGVIGRAWSPEEGVFIQLTLGSSGCRA